MIKNLSPASSIVTSNIFFMDLEITNLESTLEHIWEVARKFGLDPFPTRFEIVPAP